MKSIIFPRDEQAHNNIIEWWYFNGHLQGEDGNKYAFMDCLFQADAKKIGLPFLRVPFKKTYFSHSLLSDVKRQKFYPKVSYISLISNDSFKQPLLFVNYVDANFFDGYEVNEIKEIKPFQYQIKTENFDLILKAEKKPLLEGGNGYLNLKGRKTYYYSLTNLKTEGTIKINGKNIKVRGKSWMDHQWADTPYAKDAWNWFSIQLNNDIEMVCCEYGSGSKKATFADIIYKNGRTEHFSKIKLTPLKEKWQSEMTNAKYPLSWEIEIMEKKIKITTKPLIKQQEVIFGTINYWEGPLSVSGTFGKNKVFGVGFMELVGRPANFQSLKIMKGVFKKYLKIKR